MMLKGVGQQFCLVGVILVLGGGAVGRVAAEGEARPREIYAHFMGCYPAGSGATSWHRRTDPGRMNHEGRRQHDAYGDRWRNWPLVPYGSRRTIEEAADLDLRRGMRAGLDGFAVDAWAGGDDAKKYLSAMFKVAEANAYPFKLTICFDAGQIPAYQWLLENHGDSPNLARRDGRPLVFNYLSSFPGMRYMGMYFAQQRGADNRTDDLWRTLRNDPELRTSKEGWEQMGIRSRAWGRDSVWNPTSTTA